MQLILSTFLHLKLRTRLLVKYLGKEGKLVNEWSEKIKQKKWTYWWNAKE